MEHGNIIIYKDKNGLNNIEVKLVDNNVWLNQEQLVNLYNSSKSNISEHIKHIFEEHELEENSVVRNFRTTAKDGKSYNMKYYNLDMIVAISFRVKSNFEGEIPSFYKTTIAMADWIEELKQIEQYNKI